ncbi:MAG: hypothetical protein IH598_06250 [Bacteroidales bacterium]|nr:hypothetical protein [Bacteroidales bacterium]
MKNEHYKKMALLVFAFSLVLSSYGQGKGEINNVQAQQRVDGSDTIDVFFDLAGYYDSYIIQAVLYSNNYNMGLIPFEYCSGDYGPGIPPGNNKHFAFDVNRHDPNQERKNAKIEVRAYYPLGNPCPGQSTINFMGEEYPTIQIGGQCWLKKNLNAGVMIDYQFLPWLDDEIEKYCYDNDPSNCQNYGALYHWWEAMFYGEAIPGKQGICPPGYHIPTQEEFSILIDLFGGHDGAGGALKDINFWNNPNTGATNLSYFTARGAGSGYNYQGLTGPSDCFGLDNLSYIWTSSMNNPPHKPALYLTSIGAGAYFTDIPAEPYPFGSVRCMKDCDDIPGQANAGPDQIIANSNYTVLAATPGIDGTGKWKIVSNHSEGKKGIFEYEYKPNSEFYGYPGETYALAWTVSNECTATYDECIIEFSPFNCGELLTDHRNGKTYNTKLIGDYCWLADNMDIGEQIPLSEAVNGYDGKIQKYCYDDDPANCDIYGGLYIYLEAIQYQIGQYRKQGICPMGWFIPQDEDWCNLTTFLDGSVDCYATDWTGTDAGGKMKKDGTDYWLTPNTGATNSSGFRAVGAGYGYRYDNSNYEYREFKQSARFWSSTVAPGGNFFYIWSLGHDEARVKRTSAYSTYNANSVRCVHYPNY